MAARSGFKMPPQAPTNFNTTPELLLSDTKQILENTRKLQDEIIASVQPEHATFANILLPLAEDENRSSSPKKLYKFFSSTSTSAELRDASNASQVLVSEFEAQTFTRVDLFQLIDAVFQRGEKLDPESQLYLESKHKAFVNNGLQIEVGSKRSRFAEIRTELEKLGIAYKQSLNATSGLWFTANELDGFPSDMLAGLKTGENENLGKVWLPLKKPYLESALRYSTNEETRRMVYVGNDNRCLDNVPRLKQIVVLRDEAARLLGYGNHAEFKLVEKMAESTDWVNTFISDVRKKLEPAAKQDLEALMALKKCTKDMDINDDKLHVWDFPFYSHLIKVKEHSFDEKQFSEYFSLELSLAGMMSTISHLFGVQFFEILVDDFSQFGAGHIMTWHEEVSVFTVWNDESNGGDFLGYLYLDLFPRDKKYNHAGHYTLSAGYITDSGIRHHPSAALVMNLPKPFPDKPSLLKHGEIRSLFHELGHAIHNLVSRTKYSMFHGTATSRDFVEIPSIMLENWWWTPSVIKSLGCHYSYTSDTFFEAWKAGQKEEDAVQPAKRLSDEEIENLMNTRRVNEALGVLQQCAFAMFDMAIHSPATHEEVQAVNVSELWNKMMVEVTSMSGLEESEGWEWGHGCARFGAVMRGYDAGYFAYPIGKVYAQDLFTAAFEQNPMSKEVGMKYRKTVLEPGGSRTGEDLLEEFLGRKPTALARHKELGVSN